MSGGYFDHRDYMLADFADQIEHVIENNKKKECYHYQPEVIKEFINAVEHLRVAQIYVHRIDYLLSGDDGEETFLSRLKEDMDELVSK